MFRSRLPLAWALLAVASCGNTVQKATTQVMLVVTADAALTETATKMRFRLVPENEPPTDIPLEGRDITAGGAPVQFAIVPDSNDASRRFVAVLELLEPIGDNEDRILVTQTVDGGFVADEFREVRVNFDESCAYVHCADGFRCGDDGRCVEHCVEPTPEGEVMLSAPVACGDPCIEPESHCDEKNLVTCEDDYQVLERACGVGCNSTTKSCDSLDPSNVNVSELLPASTPPLMVPAQGLPYLCLHGNGLVQRTPEPFPANGTEGVVCGLGDDPCNAEQHGIGFQLVAVDGFEDCDGDPLSYAVFRVKSLKVLQGAGILTQSPKHPVIIVADDDIEIGGTIDVSSNNEDLPGAGGCAGGTNRSAGLGPGGGAGGMVDEQASGAGGASYGGRGGDGGHANGGALPGGAAGDPDSYDNDEALIPLLGGSGGGAGTTAVGGAGGGAIQLTSIRGQLIVGEHGLIAAGGEGGGGAFAFTGGAGGGSGGAILLEAGELICPNDPQVVHVGAPGGGGGGSENGGDGEPGDPRNVPAQGGDSNTLPGGAGSDATGEAQVGTNSQGQGGAGGGGGAGRIRINTTLGPSLCDEPEPCGIRLEPLSCGALN